MNPNSLSYPFPLPLSLSFAHSHESKGCPNSCFDRAVGLRGRGRYPFKPRIFASLLETKGYQNTLRPDHPESIFGLNNLFKITTVLFCALHSPVTCFVLYTVLSCNRVNPHVSQESKRRLVTHCQAVSKTAGSDVSCVQRDTFWPALHETPTVVAQDQGVLPEGKQPSTQPLAYVNKQSIWFIGCWYIIFIL